MREVFAIIAFLIFPSSTSPCRNEEIEVQQQQQQHHNRGSGEEMANKAANFSNLVHRVASSCFLHPLARVHEPEEENAADLQAAVRDKMEKNDENEDEEEEEKSFRPWEDEEEDEEEREKQEGITRRLREMEGLLEEVFEGVSAMKRAYVGLQEAHCPWDPEKIRVADVAVVAELRKLGRLKERFRRGGGGAGDRSRGLGPCREAVVGPYQAAVEELKREVKVREAEVEGLKERLRSVASVGRKGRFHPSYRRVSCGTQGMDYGVRSPPLPLKFCLDENAPMQKDNEILNCCM